MLTFPPGTFNVQAIQKAVEALRKANPDGDPCPTCGAPTYVLRARYEGKRYTLPVACEDCNKKAPGG